MEHKKLFKKIIAFILPAMMMLAMFPTTVIAAEKSVPTRNSALDVSVLKETTDKLSSEGWKWVPAADGGTLTLRNCFILSQPDENQALRLPNNNVTVILEGQNTIKMAKSNFDPIIDSLSSPEALLNLTIVEGAEDGKLSILRQDTSLTKENSYGISAKSITVKSGDIYTNTDFCILAYDFVMEGGSLTVDSPNIIDGVGIYSAGGNISVSGGSIDINTGQIGMFIPGNIETKTKTVSLTGGNVKIRNGLAGISAKNITVDTTGEIDIQGSKYALDCSTPGGTLEILSAASLALSGDVKPFRPDVPGGNVTLIIGNAKYTEVDNAIAQADALDANNFATNLDGVKAAVNAVTRGKNVLEQNTVNGYATAINNAIAALKYKDADYTKVDEALAKIPADLSMYTNADLKAINDAKNAVVRGKNITEQKIVDGYVQAIENALIELKKKPVISITDPDTGTKVEYEDGTLLDSKIVLNVVSKPKDEMSKLESGIEKVAQGYKLSSLYDVKLLKDGIAIQPNGKIRVSIPLTDEMKNMKTLKVVYIDDNGKVTIVPSEVKADRIVFVTDHLSYYGVIAEVEPGNNGNTPGEVEPGNNENTPQTGDSSSSLMFTQMMLVSVSAGILLYKKRKLKAISK